MGVTVVCNNAMRVVDLFAGLGVRIADHTTSAHSTRWHRGVHSMESLVAAVTRNGWQRTSEPVCYPERSKGKWRLRLMFTSRKGGRATKKYSPLCNTEQEALCGSLAFRYSWEGSQRGQPCEVSKENLVPPVAAGTTLPAGKS